jgi:hypothetical protein
MNVTLSSLERLSSLGVVLDIFTLLDQRSIRIYSKMKRKTEELSRLSILLSHFRWKKIWIVENVTSCEMNVTLSSLERLSSLGLIKPFELSAWQLPMFTSHEGNNYILLFLTVYESFIRSTQYTNIFQNEKENRGAIEAVNIIVTFPLKEDMDCRKWQ